MWACLAGAANATATAIPFASVGTFWTALLALAGGVEEVVLLTLGANVLAVACVASLWAHFAFTCLCICHKTGRARCSAGVQGGEVAPCGAFSADAFTQTSLAPRGTHHARSRKSTCADVLVEPTGAVIQTFCCRIEELVVLALSATELRVAQITVVSAYLTNIALAAGIKAWRADIFTCLCRCEVFPGTAFCANSATEASRTTHGANFANMAVLVCVGSGRTTSHINATSVRCKIIVICAMLADHCAVGEVWLYGRATWNGWLFTLVAMRRAALALVAVVGIKGNWTAGFASATGREDCAAQAVEASSRICAVTTSFQTSMAGTTRSTTGPSYFEVVSRTASVALAVRSQEEAALALQAEIILGAYVAIILAGLA
mmetsp:Transcript_83308/g.147192  ORF Transcript_83308/g.147192 Transcript_83308/m.147192 type:complete len:376 (-) Transcript_83308:2878-4005(-)